MTGIVDWAAGRARMVLAFIFLSLLAGILSYVGLPKEGEPDIEIPAIVVSLPFPGISAEDSETLLIKPMETELSDIDGLDSMTATAAEGYANIVMEFEFGWDKASVLADVRDRMQKAEAQFPDGAEQYSIEEFNFSEFPIIIVNLSGAVPERTLLQVAKNLQDRLEGLDPVLEAALAGHRDEMLEVVIDPLQLEAYNVTVDELINVVVANNQLIAAGETDGDAGSFAVKIPSSFDEQTDVYNLPIKVNGDSVVTLGDLADIRLTFEDREGTARFNEETTVALQVVKRKGFNVIDTAELIKAEVALEAETWPDELKAAINVGTSNDQSRQVASMVSQLEGSVLTAIALVMIVVLAALGTRSALLVGFAIPTSFMLCFAFLAVMGIAISNIVMFGLILAVGMLVDGAIVVVEYADKRIKEGAGPMRAYVEAAKRMFWPIVSSTATTLCAFLPMLFWPGVPGEFMGMLPVTLIFVLSASLVVALIYLPVMGGVAGRTSRLFEGASAWLARAAPVWLRLALVPLVLYGMFVAAMQVVNPSYLFGGAEMGLAGTAVGIVLFLIFAALASITLGATEGAGSSIGDSLAGLHKQMVARLPGYAIFPVQVVSAALAIWGVIAVFSTLIGILQTTATAAALILPLIILGIGVVATIVAFGLSGRKDRIDAGHRRTPFGYFIKFIAGNPVMPVITIAAIIAFVVSVFGYFGANNNGVEFFVESEPEQAIVYVRARGNMSLTEKDALLRQVEAVVAAEPGVENAFAFAGAGGLNANTGGAAAPLDTVGQIQIETIPWENRAAFAQDTGIDLAYLDGDLVIERLQAEMDKIPGIETEVLNLAQGPASGKPVHLRIKGENWEELLATTQEMRAVFDSTPGLVDIEDSTPLPGIDWQINVDVEKAGRYGANVATVGGMVQLVTRGILLDTMRVDSSDEEIDIRVRFPQEDRVLSTLDTLKVRTPDGLVPLSNFVTREPVAKLGQINRVDQKRYFDVKADVEPGLQKIFNADEELLGFARPDTASADDGALIYTSELTTAEIETGVEDGTYTLVSVNPNERIAEITKLLQSEASPIPASLEWEWTGDQEEQEESGAFLMQAFAGALGLMFIILLAQFNSFYNAALVLMAVVLSVTGCLIGMLVMGQPFSIIMTGTGIVALAGIVVNNNIVLIDTYQEYSRYMPRIEAIVRTAEARIRPVLLTTITTMAGLAPMMFGLSLDFIGGGYSVDSPTALWWKQLATAVVFGLGIATVLTLVFTPSMLALRVWFWTILANILNAVAARTGGSRSQSALDWALRRAARKVKDPEIIWDPSAPAFPGVETPATKPDLPLKAAE